MARILIAELDYPGEDPSSCKVFLNQNHLEKTGGGTGQKPLDHYSSVKIFGPNDYKKPLVRWDVPISANNSIAEFGQSKFRLQFRQRCFFSSTGFADWALTIGPSGNGWRFDDIAFFFGIRADHTQVTTTLEKLLAGSIPDAEKNATIPRTIPLFGHNLETHPLNPLHERLYVNFAEASGPRYELRVDVSDHGRTYDFGGGLSALSDDHPWMAWQQLSTSERATIQSAGVPYIFGFDLNSELVLQQIWNSRFAIPYLSGLSSVRAGSRASFVPIWTVKPGRWFASFEFNDTFKSLDKLAPNSFVVTDNVSTSVVTSPSSPNISTRLLSVSPDGKMQNVEAILQGIQAHDGSSPRFVCDIVKAPDQDYDVTPWAIGINPVQSSLPTSRQTVRSGALDLVFAVPAQLRSGSSPTGQSGKTRPYNTARWLFFPRPLNCPSDTTVNGVCLLPELELNLVFEVLEVLPGGQDDVATAEFAEQNQPLGEHEGANIHAQLCDAEIEQNFAREAPLVFLRPRENAPPAGVPRDVWFLSIAEQLLQGKSQTLRMRLDVVPAIGARAPEQQVIVIDRQPLTVAEVRFTPFTAHDQNSQTIAEWSNANGTGSSWRLVELRDLAPKLIFPPQALGEEMERDGNLCAPSTDCENRLFDFRFSPPASVTFRNSDTRYVEAPWNLRRLLIDGSVRIGQMSYELLYGLACTAEYPFLRLTEAAALNGAVRGRLPRRPLSAPPDSDTALHVPCPAQSDIYTAARLYWSKIYREYLSRIGIYTPHDEQQQGDLILKASCELRLSNANLRYSNEYWSQSDIAPALPAAPQDFKGGALWGVEQAEIYNKITNNGLTTPKSTSAELTNPSFTALGGYGSQLARFDEDRETIIQSASLGRTTHYSAERIGRIGVFWNRAKHVVVYERTVLPTEQFILSQQRFEGRPIVRKVAEYVEFLEPDRDFPSADSSPPLPGFVKGFTCGQKKRINVLGKWGTGVGDRGWKVPVWNVNANKAQPNVYPMPEMYLRVQTPEKDAQGNFVQQLSRITEPQNVFFYTSIVAGEGADTNKWSPVESVDFVNLPLQAPDVSCFNRGDLSASSAVESAVPPGYKAITFSVQSPDTGIHITEGFAGGAIGADIRAVTVSRGLLPPLAASSPILDAVPTLSQLCEQLRSNLPDRPTFGENWQQVKTSLQNVVDTYKQQQWVQISNAANDFVSNWPARALSEFGNHTKAAFDGLSKELANSESKISKAILDAHNNLSRELTNGWNTLNGDQRTKLVDIYLGQLQESFESAAGILNPAYRIKSVAIEALNNFGDGIAAALKRTLPDDSIWNGPDFLRRIQLAIAEVQSVRVALFSDLEAARVLADAFDPSLILTGQTISSSEESLRLLNVAVEARYEELARAGNSADIIAQTLKKEFEARRAAAVKAIQEKASDIGNLVKQFKDTPPLNAVVDQFQTTLLAGLPDALKSAQTIAVAVAAIDQSLKREAIVSQLTTFAQKAASDSQTLVTTLGTWLAAKETVSLNSALADVEQFIGLINGATDIPAKLLGELDARRRRAEATANEYVSRAVNSLRPLAEPALDKSLKLLRAFGAPPQVPQLQFSRPEIAYVYDQVNKKIPITPVVARANQIRDALNALDIKLPAVQLGENLIPADLTKFDLNQVFSSFGGLRMANLFPGLKLPEISGQGIQIRHGWEEQSRRAWLEAAVNVPISGTQNVFAFGPIALRLSGAQFEGNAKFTATPGEPPTHEVTAEIGGEWDICVQELNIVSFVDTKLTFDKHGKLNFTLNPSNVRLPPQLEFLSELFKAISDPNSGLTISPVPGGVECAFDLPIPDTAALVSGITGLRLRSALALRVTNDFTISIGFQLSRREQPFTFSVFILGGSGFADVRADYTPATGAFTVAANIAIACSASLAIALGPISGSVSAHFGIEGALGSGRFNIAVFLLIAGHVSLLGIVSIDVTLYLSGSYNGGQISAYGHVSYKIKMFMFTLEVSADVGTRISGSGQSSNLVQPQSPQLAALTPPDSHGPGLAYAFERASMPSPPSQTPAFTYVSMLV